MGGGLPEAVVRALMHVRLPSRTVDERGFAVLQAVRQILPANRRIGFDELKQLFRDQYLLVRLDEERAIRAIPKLLPDDPELRAAAWQVVQDILSASGSLTPEEQSLMQRLEPMFVGARTLPQENQDA